MTINMIVDQKKYPFLAQEFLKLNCTATRRKGRGVTQKLRSVQCTIAFFA
jgi:hypothetical protein